MLEARAEAERLISDPRPTIRACAAEILADYWRVGPNDTCIGRIRLAAIEDLDAGARAAALGALARCYRGTDDVPVGRLLASAAANENGPLIVRESAYLGLYVLRNTVPSGPFVHQRTRGVPSFVPDRIDWPFLRSFLDERRVPSPVALASVGESARPKGTDRAFFDACRSAGKALDEGRYEDAIRLSSDLIRQQPTAIGPYKVRGNAFIRLGRPGDAARDLAVVKRLLGRDKERAEKKRKGHGSGDTRLNY